MNVSTTARKIRNLRIRNLFRASRDECIVAAHDQSEDARLFARLSAMELATHVVRDLDTGTEYPVHSEGDAIDMALDINARGHTARVELTEVGEVEVALALNPLALNPLALNPLAYT